MNHELEFNIGDPYGVDSLEEFWSVFAMIIRMFRLGLAAFAVGTQCPIGLAWAQVPDAAHGSTPSNGALTVPRSNSGVMGSAKRRLRDKPQKIEDGDVWKKHPPIWSLKDPTPYAHPYAAQPDVAPGVGAHPGGPAGQFGSPYYYSANAQFGGAGLGIGGAIGPAAFNQPGYGAGVAPQFGGGYLGGDMGYGGPGYGGFGGGPGFNGYGPMPIGAGFAGGGVPQTAALPGDLPGNPYLYHFGPGFYRFQEAGHYRFPYYSYRRPWYFPGHPSYNRDTNIPW